MSVSSLLKSTRFWRWAVVVTLAAVVLWYAAAYPRGVVMAYLDHARGQEELRTWGLPPPEPLDRELRTLLRERYGVALHRGGCELPPRWGYDVGYAETARSLTARQHGKDILAECAEDALQKVLYENAKRKE
jgi:hypothetical protein